MGLFCKLVLLILVLLAVLHNSSGGKKGFGGKSTPSKKPSDKPSQGTKTQPNYPRQPSHPGAGSNPGYPNQYPGRGGSNPGGYPNQNPGFYPVRTAGQPGGYPGGHPSIGGGYPNWNPNNKILSPRYGGSFGGGGFGMGGSPFSQTVRGMGYGPSVQSKGFAKKAMLAAGVGAMAGTAVGYGIGNFPRPNFQFRSPQEERHYNNYMYQHHGTHSKGGNNKRGPSYTSKLPPQAQSYDQFMNTCMKQSDLLKEQNMKDSAVRNNIQRDEPLTDYLSMNEGYLEKGELEKNDTASPTTVIDYPKNAGIHNDEDDDTVSIIEIGYPALIEQMKTRKCVEQYLVYSESFPEKQKEKNFGNHNGHSVSGVLLFLTTSFMLFRGT